MFTGRWLIGGVLDSISNLQVNGSNPGPVKPATQSEDSR